jgi:hypothetical protein
MGFCLYFYLALGGCLILFGVGIIGVPLLLLRLRMVLGSVVQRIGSGLRCLLQTPLKPIVPLLSPRKGLLIVGL